MSEELKACAHCGAPAEMDTNRGYSHYPPNGKTGTEVAIYCTSCMIEVAFDPHETGDSIKDVIDCLTASWNTRAPDPRITELEEARDQYVQLFMDRVGQLNAANCRITELEAQLKEAVLASAEHASQAGYWKGLYEGSDNCQAVSIWQDHARAMEAQRDELAGVLNVIRCGAYPRPAETIWRKDGRHSKHDKCPHHRFMYDDCASCVEDYASTALAKIGGEG